MAPSKLNVTEITLIMPDHTHHGRLIVPDDTPHGRTPHGRLTRGCPPAPPAPLSAGLPPPPHVTPEAVLAAVAFLRDKGEMPPSLRCGYPNARAVILRLILVLLVSGFVAGERGCRGGGVAG